MLFETERLYIRKFVVEDAKRLSEYRNKREVSRYQTWHIYTYIDAIRRIRYCNKHPILQKGVNTQYAIVLKESNYIIGDIFIEIRNNSTAVIGYTLDNLYWHKGYAYEAIKSFLKYLKQEGYSKVYAYVYNENMASIRLLEKLEFNKINQWIGYNQSGYYKEL